MITLFEVLAMLTLAGIGVAFVRRRIRRGSALALVLAGFSMAFALAPAATATEFRHDKRVTIRKDEVIHSDLYAAGGRIQVEGTIEGDLLVAGGEVEITGHIMGDVLSSAGTVRVIGQVDGNIRGYAGNFTLRGAAGRNVTMFGGDVNIDRDAKIGGSITSFSGHLSIDGRVGRDVLAFVGQANITGAIAGSVRITGGELNIDSSARIDGTVKFKGDRPPEVSQQAKLASPVQYEKLKHGPDYRSYHFYLWHVIWAAAYILYGMVLFLLMSGFSKDAVKAAEEYGAAAGLAILVGLGLPIAACIACLTVVGLFIGLSTLALWYGALYFGLVVASAVVGQWLMGRTRELWPLIGRMVVGVVIVRLFTMIPEVGWIVKYGTAFWGLGAISLAAYRRFQPVIAPGMPPGQIAQPLPPNTTVGGMQPA